MDYTQKQTAPSLRKTDLALAVLFCAALGIGCLTIIVRMGTRALMKLGLCPPSVVNVVFRDKPGMIEGFKREHPEAYENVAADINWWKLYPLSQETEEFYARPIELKELPHPAAQEEEQTRFVLQIPKAASIVKKIDTWLNQEFVFLTFFAERAKYIQKYLGVLNEALYIEGNKIVKLPNGYYINPSPKIDVTESAANLLKFNEFLTSRGIPFLYVQTIRNDPDDLAVIKAGDFSNQNADELFYLIDGKVNYLDLRAEIKKAGMNHYDCYYRTDHHWKSETGLWAARVIAQRLNADFDFAIDTEVLNPANFNFEVLSKSFLGSNGRAVTLTGADMEDFTLITPKNDFSLEAKLYTLTNQLIEDSGGFDILLEPENIQTKQTVYKKSTYGVYARGGYQHGFIKNNSAQNNLRILIFGDSFLGVVTPFFILCVKNTDTLSPRHFNGSLSAFIDAHDYDACVMLVNPDAIGHNTTYFDFR